METLGPGIGGGSDDGRNGVPEVWHWASRERPTAESPSRSRRRAPCGSSPVRWWCSRPRPS